MKPADHSGDPVLQDALDRGYLDSGQTYEIPGFRSHQAALLGTKSLHRAARRMNLSLACWVSDDQGEQCYEPKVPVSEYCYDVNGEHRVHFKLWSKNGARAHVFRQAQGDASNLRYNPWERPVQRKYSDDGQRQ